MGTSIDRNEPNLQPPSHADSRRINSAVKLKPATHRQQSFLRFAVSRSGPHGAASGLTISQEETTTLVELYKCTRHGLGQGPSLRHAADFAEATRNR
eukprot:4423020-Pyramimonas_sp.AAC.2